MSPESLSQLERKLWEAADNLRANSGLKSHEYSVPVLGLIFLKFADTKFQVVKEILEEELKNSRRGNALTPERFQAKGVMFLPEESQYSFLQNLAENEDIGKKINDAMRGIEKNTPELEGVLPKNYTQFENKILFDLIRTFSAIPSHEEGDWFGKIYEYFLGKFAMSEGQKGGEFFTPTSIVKLIVEIIEPYHGRIFDPACGSGGMFVQSGEFVRSHKENKKEEDVLVCYGQEKTDETVKLCKMNLAVHGLTGDIKNGNSFYEDIHESIGKFDFVMANPPFNVKGVQKEKIKEDSRFNLGIPNTDNANTLWLQIFLNSLNEKGRAGFVMANSASDARNQEQEVRKKIIESGVVDVMISVSSNFFYTVTLPVTLWFFDKAKAKTDRKDKILFIDARNIFKQVDRAHREWTDEHIEKIASIVKKYRGEEEGYEDIKGLCKVATLKEVAEQDYSLNPGRYTGVEEVAEDEYDFAEKLGGYKDELEGLNEEAHELEKIIQKNLSELIK